MPKKFLDKYSSLCYYYLKIKGAVQMKEKYCVFIGSSVCRGTGSETTGGWAKMLGEKMEKDGWTVEHCSIGGQNTSDILLRLNRDVIEKEPELCIVGLGLANEGLHKTENAAEAECVRAVFDSNMRSIIKALQKAGIRVCAGGVYPSNRYNDFQYAALLKEEDLSDGWGVPVFHWLSALDDGQGHFREGLYFDNGHPNDEGYRVMLSCVPEFLKTV